MSEFKIKVRPEPYRTRNGGKTFAVQVHEGRLNYVKFSDECSRHKKGWIESPTEPHELDIIGDWEDQPATAALPDRMEVWLRFAAEIVSTAIPRGGFMDFPIDDCAKFAGKLADAMTAEYERRKGGGK